MRTILLFLSVFLSVSLFGQIKCEATHEIEGYNICVPEIQDWIELYSVPESTEMAKKIFLKNEIPIAFYLNKEQIEKGNTTSDFIKINSVPTSLNIDFSKDFISNILAKGIHKTTEFDKIETEIKNQRNNQNSDEIFIKNSIFYPNTASCSILIYSKRRNIDYIGSRTYLDCGGVLIGRECWQQFESRESCITVTNLSRINEHLF